MESCGKFSKARRVLEGMESSGGQGRFCRQGRFSEAREGRGGKDTDVFACPVLVQGLALSAQRII